MSLARRAMAVLATPQILLMVAKVYIPVLFPLTFLILLLALWLDRLLGFGHGFLPPTVAWGLAITSFLVGSAIWTIAYAAIVFDGKGSPSPTAGRTQHLVTTGIYGLCRYPSVWGKTFGVLAVGLAMNSLSFCCILVPLLLAGSLVEKIWRQEPQNEAVFGDAWVRYRQEVPFFIPWKLLVPRRVR